MTLKVVRGSVGQSSSPLKDLNQNSKDDRNVNGANKGLSTGSAQTQAQTQAQQQAAVNSASSFSNLVRVSEAVISTVKATSKAAAGETRIKDYSEAKDVADKVSDEVRREEDTATSAHGALSANDARGHFAE